MKRKLSQRILEEPLLIPTEPQVNYKELTQDMLNNSLKLYNSSKQKQAHEVLSQAIRYYYSQDLQIFKDVTNFELINFLKIKFSLWLLLIMLRTCFLMNIKQKIPFLSKILSS